MSKLIIPDNAANHLPSDYNLRNEAEYGKDSNSKSFNADMPRGSENDDGSAGNVRGVKSIFNQYNLFAGAGDDIIVDEDLPTHSEFMSPNAAALINNPRGHVIYDWADFAYATMYGIVPNNRMITLRRFAKPITDDITNTVVVKAPEVSRLVTWFDGENNKLEDMLSWKFNIKYKQLNASVESASVEGGSTDGVNGWMKTLAKFIDPKFGDEALRGATKLSIAPNHDHNQVHGPVDVIDETHIRDRGLNFNNEFTLTFLYSAKSIDGINAKSAMIDLLSNVLACTYNNAKFWGGARYWTGPRPSKFWDAAFSVEKHLITAGMTGNFDDIMNYVQGAVNQFMSTPVDTLKEIASAAFRKFTIAKLINTIGRPSIPVMNSLLRGDPIGEWHVMIGNPLRPIVSMGNMIITSVNIQPTSSELTYDDFPTNYKVTIGLKHAMPRDKAGIESMMTAGKGRTYWKPSDEDFKTKIKPKLANKYNTASGGETVKQMIDRVYEDVHDFVANPAAQKEVDAINNAKLKTAKK